jgi:glycosyltransferase involved in cell wall biosynthesis
MSDQPRRGYNRVVYHLNSVGLGGMELHALDLARGMVRMGWQAEVILPELPVLDGLAADFVALGVPCHRITLIGAQNKPLLAYGWMETVRRLRRFAPQVFHQHRTGPYHGKWGVLAARAAGVPVVVASEHQAAYRLHGAKRRLNALADRSVDAFIAVSEHDYGTQRCESGRPVAKLVRIHNGIDAARFDGCSQPAVASLRVALGIASDAPVVGVIGRLEQQKGISYFLQALPLLAARRPGLVALIVGDGSMMAALQAQAAALGVAGLTRFTGFLPDVAQVLALLDVVVIPSIWEPFGLVALEAMAAGRPVVASNVGGLPEIISNGETGLLVAAADPAALAAAIERLWGDADLCARLAVCGRQRVAAGFSLQMMATKVDELYRRLLAQHSAQ